MAVSFPALVVSGGVISAAYQNAIRNALIATYAEIYDWDGNVDASGFDLLNVGDITCATVTASGVISGASGVFTGAISADSLAIDAGIVAGTGTFSGGVSAASVTLLAAAAGTSLVATDSANSTLTIKHTHPTVSNPITFSGGGSSSIVFEGFPAGVRTDNFGILGDGSIWIPRLPSINPGAGTKRLWYDPADGNRVKFAA